MATTTAPPRVLTLEEFRSDWEPAGWKLIIIGPTATWRTEWTEWEAIRDIVQNALDETEGYSSGYDDQGLWIRDAGKGIAIENFLLGPASLKPDHARGKFGEGMKIAALTLLRKGYSVKVDTAGREVYLVFVKVPIDGQVEQLAAIWRPGGRSQGTVFHIIGYHGPDFKDRFAVNIPGKDIVWQDSSQLVEPIRRRNQIIASPPGRIYARDIYMRDIKSPFSYNLWSFPLAPDRHAPRDENDLWVDVGRTWATVSNEDLLARFLGMIVTPPLEDTDEGRHVSMNAWSMGMEPVSHRTYAQIMQENGDGWRRAWKRAGGENRVIRTSDRWDGTVKHLGYESVSVSWYVRDMLVEVIRTDGRLVAESQERLREVEVALDDRLTERQLTHLLVARALAALFPGISQVHAALIPPASERTRTAGLYQRSTAEIYIATDMLESGRHTVDTTIHEVAHHVSRNDAGNGEDNTEGHNRAMTTVAARVVKEVASHGFDPILKDVAW